ncbi:putative mediator of rna polymerase ii transcription subunit 13 protein [Eutypa lata UCREL1]|uniref:Mediator of RNA polymerase II transcription subunit 13 n=1 Tax=Eutypa lata (strain UCR-EL1) TaxID=1287681 RepID=M7SUP0_EUTLA|nr:putative mediator of rna polymerase ii transcription subunit 13 protein [Eutypa lata UCREL1]
MTVQETNFVVFFVYSPDISGSIVESCVAFHQLFEGYKKLLARRKGKSIVTPLADVAHEIWETTRDLVSAWKVHWRIIITKCGAIEQHEIDIWSALAQAESKAAMSLTLLAVDTDPSLQLIPPAAKIPTSSTSAFYTTPVSTPQPSMVSPEQSAPTPGSGSGGLDNVTANSAATNPGNTVPEPSDADSTLTDVTDHTWGAVLAHRLSINPQAAAADFGQTALISGYLVKRGGARVDDPPALIEVNVVYVHQHGSNGSGGGTAKENTGNPNSNNSGTASSAAYPQTHHGQSSAQSSPVAHAPPPHLHHPRAYEPLLREVLVQYRALGSLARARGVTDREVDARPWHVAAAEKGVRALYLLM